VNDERWRAFEGHAGAIERGRGRVEQLFREGVSLEQWLRRPDVGWAQLCAWSPEVAALEVPRRAAEQIEIDARYAGYVRRQQAHIERTAQMESWQIPERFDYVAVPQLRAEARQKFGRVKPRNLGQAGRISGITPADIAILMMYVRPGGPSVSAGEDNAY